MDNGSGSLPLNPTPVARNKQEYPILAHAATGPATESAMPLRSFAFWRFLLALLVMGGAIPQARATWSIIAVHPRTGTIGVAAASCSGGVFGIQSVAPGTGAVIVQAESNNDARREAMQMLREHASPEAILARISDPAAGFSPQRQQYAVFASATNAPPRIYTGAEVPAINGHATGEHFSVQGNTLASEHVIASAAAALGKADWQDDLAMAHALMRALKAGAAAGGDRRCGQAASNTAFVSLYRATDPPDAPWVSLSVNRIPAGTASGTDALDSLFARWLREDLQQPSTAIFVVPEASATVTPAQATLPR